jgi:hypothetical protein
MILGLVSFGTVVWDVNNVGDINVDVAFQLAQPYFIERHLQFGEQVVFTYGPWGILLTAFSGPSYHVAVLVFRVALAASVFLAICLLAERKSDRAGRRVAWGGAIALVLMWITCQRDSYFLFPALLVAYQRLAAGIVDDPGSCSIGRAETLLWIALSLLAGWVALAKFNILVVSTVAYLLILADDVERRRFSVLPFAYIGALLLAWTSAGQNLVNLPVWVLSCLNLSNGYADAMAKGFFIPYGAGLVAIYYGAVMLIMVAALAATALYRWKFPALLSLLLTLFICAVAVKHGMGGNQVEQSLAVLATALWFVSQLLAIPSLREVERSVIRQRQIGQTAALTALLCLAVVGANTNFPIVSLRQALADMPGNASLLADTLRGFSTDKWAASLARTHRFWVPSTVPTGQTIDIYPQQTGLVIGREGLRYSPRPAFLSLNAHTYALALLNAHHLEESTAPDLILFQVLPKERTVNNRHPALADGPSWPLLLSRYELDNAGDEFLLLKKRPQPLHIDRQLLLERDLQQGEKVLLPHGAGDLLWAEVEIKRSASGSILHALYKSPHVLLESRTVDNATYVFQIVPELGKAGFLMSPLVQNNAAFSELYRGRGMPGDIVESISISSPEAPRFFWTRTFKLRLYALNIGRR